MSERRAKKVIIIEEDPAYRELLKKILKSLRCDVVGEESGGQKAIYLYERKKPDIVLLNIRIPLEHGLEVLKDLKKLNPYIVVLIITTVTEEATIKRCFEAGASGYILKSGTANEIQNRLKKFIYS
ncbi:response regulator transcription factor [Gemmatimonadota bacterium]